MKEIDSRHENKNSNYIVEINFNTHSDVEQKLVFGIEQLVVGLLTGAVCQELYSLL
jgi:hypothetical protein